MKLYPTVLIPDLEDKLLIPVENVYLLTEFDIKKIVIDAFDAGKISMANNKTMISDNDGRKGIHVNTMQLLKDKEDYLNNLKLD